MMALPLAYTAIVTPLQIALLKDSGNPVFAIDRLVDALFIIDLVCSLA